MSCGAQTGQNFFCRASLGFKIGVSWHLHSVQTNSKPRKRSLVGWRTLSFLAVGICRRFFSFFFAVTVFQENARKFREVFSFRASACVFRHVSKSGTRKVVRSEPPSLLTVLILKRRYCCILAHVYFQGNFCNAQAVLHVAQTSSFPTLATELYIFILQCRHSSTLPKGLWSRSCGHSLSHMA